MTRADRVPERDGPRLELRLQYPLVRLPRRIVERRPQVALVGLAVGGGAVAHPLPAAHMPPSGGKTGGTRRGSEMRRGPLCRSQRARRRRASSVRRPHPRRRSAAASHRGGVARAARPSVRRRGPNLHPAERDPLHAHLHTPTSGSWTPMRDRRSRGRSRSARAEPVAPGMSQSRTATASPGSAKRTTPPRRRPRR